MNTSEFTPGSHAVIHRLSSTEWQAVAGDRILGRGDASPRPDGRLFLSIDSWQDAIFDQLAGAMVADLPGPLYTIVDEPDTGLVSRWARAGFALGRREWEYLAPTAPGDTVLAPAGIEIIPVGGAESALLRALDRAIRDELAATGDSPDLPPDWPHPGRTTRPDPAEYAVAVAAGDYLGLVRVTPTRNPRVGRIGLLAVRADHRRRGIGRALLAAALATLRERGIVTAALQVGESNTAMTALLDGFGGQRANSGLELVRR